MHTARISRTIFLIIPFLLILGKTASCNKIDSLLVQLEQSKDTTRFIILRELVIEYKFINLDSAMLYAKKGLELSKFLKRNDKLGEFYDLSGHLYEQSGNLDISIENFRKAYDIFLQENMKSEAVKSLSNLGAMLVDNARYEEASTNLYDALKKAEELNDIRMQGTVLTNIGLLFFNQEDWEKSISYYRKSTDCKKQTNDLTGLALNYNNIGIAYYYKGELDSVLSNFERSLDMYIKLGNKLGQTRPLSNIGEIYYLKGDYDKALEYFHKSLAIEKELSYQSGIAKSLLYIGSIYTELKEFDKALDYQYEGLEISQNMGSPSILMEVYEYLYETFKKMGIADSALKYYINLTEIKDSLLSIEKSKQINELETIYETKKKEQQIFLQEVKLKNKTKGNWALITILILFMGLVIQGLRVFKINKASNISLEEKNKLLKESNRQITNSITYASFIQSAILPPKELFESTFPEHFIFFKPKDIVSGDFYWLTKKENDVIIAVADCTGHGVPGAFMSMLGMTFLNEIINIYGLTSTNEILNTLRTKIMDALRQKEGTTDTRDGLDIAICRYNTETMLLEFSGAYLPVIVHDENGMQILKGDRMPIGYHKSRKAPFTKVEVELNRGTTLYLYSDGYADQFGEESGKKYTRNRFYEFVKNISALDIQEQKKKLEAEHNNWKGNKEQIDDITILGLRI